MALDPIRRSLHMYAVLAAVAALPAARRRGWSMLKVLGVCAALGVAAAIVGLPIG